MDNYSYNQLLRSAISGEHLTRSQTRWAFGQIMEGVWPDSQIAGLLVAMAAKGHVADELAGAAEAMREHVITIDNAGFDVIDTCGTGGSGVNSFNISTAAGLVAAGAGVKVAKHGNRTATRASGSADALAELGVNINAEPAVANRCLREAGVCFCFAIRCHPAMKYAAPVRKALGVRTIFNLIGPLTNPAMAKRQLMGVFAPGLTETIASVLGMLGSKRAIVVRAEDGLDEISTASDTKMSHLRNGEVQTQMFKPEDVGLPRAKLEDLLVTDARESARVIRNVLSGKKGPTRDIVLLNAAAALSVATDTEIHQCLEQARESIDNQSALRALESLIELSNQPA